MFMGSQKNEYIFRYEAFVDIFGIITKLDHIHGLFPCILGYFIKIKVQNSRDRRDVTALATQVNKCTAVM